jgi:hypothetical protein
MRYAKPEIVVMGQASAIVQGLKAVGNPDHKRTPDIYQTVSAYLADD